MEEIKLHNYQEVIKDFIVTHPYCAVWLDIGLGKTLTTLKALSEMQDLGHVLIIAPLTVAKSTWAREIKKWNFNVRTVSLVLDENGKKLSPQARQKLVDEAMTAQPTLYFINRDLVKWLVEEAVPKTKIKHKGRNKEVIQWPFSTVIIDESQNFAKMDSKRTKALITARPAIKHLIELTGTPSPNGLIDLYGQIYLLDGGQALGRTKTAFLDTFFEATKYVNNRPVKWEPRPGAREAIYSRIAHLALSMENVEVKIDKPILDDVFITLDYETLKKYRKFKRDMVLELASTTEYDENGNPIAVTISPPNQAVLYAKLIQYASGTIYIDEERHYEIIHSEKLDLTEYIVENSDSNILIAYRYVAEKELIYNQLKEKGYNVQVFDGSPKMEDEWNAKNIRAMLIHPASAGSGLNLQDGGHHLLWYTLPDSAEHYNQTIGRLARQGQTNAVIVHRLITSNTQDEQTPMRLDAKTEEERNLVKSVRYDLNNL